MAQAQARLAQQQQAIRHRRVGSQDMDVDEANYCETQVTEEDDEDEDPDDSEQVHELRCAIHPSWPAILTLTPKWHI